MYLYLLYFVPIWDIYKFARSQKLTKFLQQQLFIDAAYFMQWYNFKISVKFLRFSHELNHMS